MNLAAGIALRVAGLLALAAVNAAAASIVIGFALGVRRPFRPLAEVRRLLSGEDSSASATDPLLFRSVPALVLLSSVLALAPLSFAGYLGFGSPDAGLLVTFGALALAPVGMLLAATSADAFPERSEAMRAAVSRAAWGIPLALSAITPAMIAGGLEPLALVNAQRGTWLFGLLPRWFALSPHVVAFVLFAVSAYLATAPLVHRDEEASPGTSAFSGARMAILRLAELTATFAVCALAATVFFGGWLVPYVDRSPVAEALGPVVFAVKTYALMYALARLRALLPRIAHARPVSFAWTRLAPLSLVWIAVYAAATRGGGL